MVRKSSQYLPCNSRAIFFEDSAAIKHSRPIAYQIQDICQHGLTTWFIWRHRKAAPVAGINWWENVFSRPNFCKPIPKNDEQREGTENNVSKPQIHPWYGQISTTCLHARKTSRKWEKIRSQCWFVDTLPTTVAATHYAGRHSCMLSWPAPYSKLPLSGDKPMTSSSFLQARSRCRKHPNNTRSDDPFSAREGLSGTRTASSLSRPTQTAMENTPNAPVGRLRQLSVVLRWLMSPTVRFNPKKKPVLLDTCHIAHAWKYTCLDYSLISSQHRLTKLLLLTNSSQTLSSLYSSMWSMTF